MSARALRVGLIASALFLVGHAAFAQTVRARVLRVGVDGMVCSFCSQGIVKIFKAQKDVLQVIVGLEEKEVRVVLREGSLVRETDVAEWVKDAGFKARYVAFEDAAPSK